MLVRCSLKFAGSLLCLGAIVAIWVAMAEIVQSVQQGDDSYTKVHPPSFLTHKTICNLSFLTTLSVKPYFMSYLVHGSFSVFLIIWIIWQVVKAILRRRAKRGYKSPHILDDNSECSFEADREGATLLKDEEGNWLSDIKQHALLTLVYSLLTFVVAYTWYISLPLTPVSVNTAIYNAACVFVFLFSVILLKEPIPLLKIAAVLFCVGGIVVLCIDGIEDSSGDEKNSIWGYVLVIVSTMFYSLYEVLLKRWGAHTEKKVSATISEEDDEDEDVKQKTVNEVLRRNLKVMEHSFLFTGLLGFFTLVVTWPGIFVVDLLDYEKFELPEGKPLYGILITMALDPLYNLFLLLGITIASPLFISVGTLLTIPVSVAADCIIHGTVLPLRSYFGMMSIVVGFLLLTLSEYLHSRVNRRRRKLLDTGEDKRRWISLY